MDFPFTADPNKDPCRTTEVFYFSDELDCRLKRRQAQMKELGLPFHVDYLFDAAMDWAYLDKPQRYFKDDIQNWNLERIARKVPGWELLLEPSTPDDEFSDQVEFALTKYLDHLDGSTKEQINDLA